MLVDTLIYILIFASIYLTMGVVIALLINKVDDPHIGEMIVAVLFWPVLAITWMVVLFMIFVMTVIDRWRE